MAVYHLWHYILLNDKGNTGENRLHSKLLICWLDFLWTARKCFYLVIRSQNVAYINFSYFLYWILQYNIDLLGDKDSSKDLQILVSIKVWLLGRERLRIFQVMLAENHPGIRVYIFCDRFYLSVNWIQSCKEVLTTEFHFSYRALF